MDAIRALVERYEALRTSYHVAADGVPYQVSAADGGFDVEIRPVRGSCEDQAVAVAQKLRLAAGDVTAAWSSHFTLITEDEQPRYLVFAVSHFSVDGWGMRVLTEEFHRLLNHDRPPRAQEWQPIDQARFEAGAAGEKRSRRSVAYWRHCLSRRPENQLTLAHGDPAEPRFQDATLESAVLPGYERILAQRYGATGSSVMTAAVAVLLGTYTASSSCLLELIVCNRIETRLLDSVCNIAQNSILLADLTPGTFGAVIQSTNRSIVSTNLFGQYDPLRLEAEIRELRAKDPSVLPHLCCVNDKRIGGAGGLQQSPPAPAASEPSTFTWGERYPSGSTRFFFAIEGDASRTRLRLHADALYMPPADVNRFLFGVEALLAHAAEQDTPLADVAAVAGIPVIGGVTKSVSRTTT
ncbi:condensation domain-containing protein [Nonomuraea jabiensis]|uniref:Condensation domain-containing protein n=1 Tax=Nonomuraea jabiensis TaxID=882448 RepID=A0A7W9G0I7_9ACTN|nr:condensation domain-containing protein [Nonomuraea jabiensis]MBB5774968.1 hypothetical protein [Nonomuraea jabiensis]